MITLYFAAPPTATARTQMAGLWGDAGSDLPGRRYTPAQLEQLCAECETIEELLDSLGESRREALEKTKSALERSLSRGSSRR
jgi:hypothetical protein